MISLAIAFTLSGSLTAASAARLRQLPGAAGCLTIKAVAGCGHLPSGNNGVFSADLLTGYFVTVDGIDVYRRPSISSGFRPLPGTGGCLRYGRQTGCSVLRSEGVSTLVVSRNGRNVYRLGHGFLFAMRRDLKTGALSEIRGRGGCLSGHAHPGCIHLDGLNDDPGALLFGSGETSAYVTAGETIRALTRDRRTGALAPVGGSAGCASFRPKRGCTRVRGNVDLSNAIEQWGPGQRQLYFVGDTHIGVLGVSDRGLTAHIPLCLDKPRAQDCPAQQEDKFLSRLSFSPDGRHAYAETHLISYGSSMQDEDTISGRRLIVLDRDPASGALTFRPGRSCAAPRDTTHSRCIKARVFYDDSIGTLVVSPSGHRLYDLDYGAGIAVFQLGQDGISISQAPGTSGCVRSLGDGCARVPGASKVARMFLSNAGDYAALSTSRGLTVARLDSRTGALLAGRAADTCIVFMAMPGCRVGRGMFRAPSGYLAPDGHTAVVSSDGGWARFSLPGGTWTAPAQP